MANTYSQLYVQFVFAVKGRYNLISSEHREELHKYITGIIQNKGHKMLAIFAMPNHIHIFIGKKPNINESDLVRDIKTASTKFINEKGWTTNKFNWQVGFGAFSYSNSQLDVVINYILNQEQHHRTKTFSDEYLDLLEKFDVDFKPEYLFDNNE